MRIRMLTLLWAPDKRPRVTCECWENSIVIFCIRLHNTPPCHCASSPATWQKNVATAPAAILFSKGSRCFWRMCGKEPLSPARAGFIRHTLASVFGVWLPWSSGVLALPCDRVVTQRFFMASGMVWLWTHCKGKSGLLIHTDGLFDRPLSSSFRWREQLLVAQRTLDSSVSERARLVLLESDRTHSSRWSRHCISVDWTHLLSPKAWHCVYSHTHTHTSAYAYKKHMLPPPPRQNLKLLGQKADHSLPAAQFDL